MALQSIVFSNEIFDKVNGFTAIDENQYPILDENEGVIDSVGDYPADFSSAYETYSLTGEVLGAVHGAQEPGIIESFMRTFNTSITAFATALADYWGTVLIVPGSPMHGGVSVSTVTNDAPSQVGAFYDAITASLTQDWKMPVYQHFINNIESIALPQCTWYVTEIMPNGSPSTFPEKVF